MLEINLIKYCNIKTLKINFTLILSPNYFIYNLNRKKTNHGIH